MKEKTTLPEPPDNEVPLHERFTYRVVPRPPEEAINDESKWPRTRVEVLENGEPIYTYDRNYGMIHTFHAFRQFKDGVWRNYALISPKYSTYSVLDLQTLEIIATRGYPQRDWYRSGEYDQYKSTLEKNPEWFEPGGYYEGKGPNDKINGEGFCPMDFYVPVYDKYYEDGDGFQPDGMHGFVSGCIWGDDTSSKIRHIDLSRITEGIIEEDERYGYIEMPDGPRRLSECIDYSWGFLKITLSLGFTEDGKLRSWHKKELPEFEEEKK